MENIVVEKPSTSKNVIHDLCYLSKKTSDLIKDHKPIPDECVLQKSPLGNTVLHVAARYQNDDLVEKITKNASHLLSARNKNGDTALHVAARYGHVSTLRKLFVACILNLPFPYSEIPKMADVETLVRNKQGNTFFHEALLNGHAPKDVRSMLGSNETLIRVGLTEFVEREALFRKNNDGQCVLYLAIKGGYKEFVDHALEKLRSPLPQVEEDQVYDDWSESAVIDIKMQIQSPRSPLQCPPASKQQESPLIMAILKKDKDILEMILSINKEWIHSKDDDGKIPIHYAASIGYVHGVEVLLQECIYCIMNKDNDGLSPLHLACAGGHPKVVEKLLEHEHCPDPREILDNKDRNMVHIAALMGKFDVIKYILQDDRLVEMINDQDNEGNTPLHLATEKCHPKVVHALTWKKRVDPTLVNKNNETALDTFWKSKQENPPLRQRLVWTALISAGVVQHCKKGSHYIKVPPLPQSTENGSKQKDTIKMDLYKDRINTLILVSTIITTVAFAAGITLPGGTNSSDPGHGMALMLKHAWFNLFIFCITVSMYGSISAVIILLWAQLGDITLALYSLKVAMPVLGVTLTSLSVAFMAAVHLVISDLSWLATTIMVLCVIFILMLLFLYVLVCWFPSESKKPFIRRISYYPFLFETWLESLDKQDD